MRLDRALNIAPIMLLLASIALVVAGPRQSIAIDGRLVDLSLSSLALISAFVLLVAAWRCRQSRSAWLLIATGLIAWRTAQVGYGAPSGRSAVVAGAGYLLFAGAIIAGTAMFAGLHSVRGDRRQLSLDLIPAAIAIALAGWLSAFGPGILQPNRTDLERASIALHGLGSVALMTLCATAFAFERRTGTTRALRVLLLSIFGLAIADALSVQHVFGSAEWQSRAAVAAFTVVFIGLAAAGIESLRGHQTPKPNAGAGVEEGWESQIQHLALGNALVLAAAQTLFGELVRYGTLTAVGGALLILCFSWARQSFAVHRERSLRKEIDQLSEQIDGLISQVGRDPLTGLLNHRAIHERLDHELANGRVSSHSVAVVLIDVDNFKTVNDTLGHQTGDRVLYAVAAILTSACRGSDVAARYAGDEFMLLLPGLDEPHAWQVCSRISSEVRRINDDLQLPADVRITLSVGVAVTHLCLRSVAHTIAIADAAMYDAKEGGKDQVVVVDADKLVIAEQPTQPRSVDELMAATRPAKGWRRTERRPTG